MGTKHTLHSRASLFYSLVQVLRRLSLALKKEFVKTQIDKKNRGKQPSPLTPAKLIPCYQILGSPAPFNFLQLRPCCSVCVYIGGGRDIYHCTKLSFDVFTRGEKVYNTKVKEGGWGNVLTMLKVRVRLGGGVS